MADRVEPVNPLETTLSFFVSAMIGWAGKAQPYDAGNRVLEASAIIGEETIFKFLESDTAIIALGLI